MITDPIEIKYKDVALLNKIESVADQINLIGLIDHGGRAGSNFVQCLFDRHTEVVSCPLVHYVYSYWIDMFRDRDEITQDEAIEFVASRSYFRFVYNSPDNKNAAFIKKIGGGDKITFDFDRYHELVDAYLDSRLIFSRKELLSVLYVIYAYVFGKELKQLKYFLVNDAVSIRGENMFIGFSAKTIDVMREDYPDSWIVLLVRDPRAQFASTRHQLVNEYGNNYAVSLSTFLKRVADLFCDRISMDSGPAHLISYMYQCASAKTALGRFTKEDKRTVILRNEDINLFFLPTMQSLANKLDFHIDPEWENISYIPSMLGVPWEGTGAYSDRYQTFTNGPLQNDTSEQVVKAVGPNRHVTERWKKRMSRREVELSERLLCDELKYLGYTIYYDDESRSDFSALMRTAWFPASGELPSLRWIMSGWREGVPVYLSRLFYAMIFPLFYVLSRVKLFRYVLRDRFFINIVDEKLVRADNFIKPGRCDKKEEVV